MVPDRLCAAKQEFEHKQSTQPTAPQHIVTQLALVDVSTSLNISPNPWSRDNLIAWMNSIVLVVCKKAKLSKEEGTGRELPGCYEGLSCTDLQEVVGALGELYDWKVLRH